MATPVIMPKQGQSVETCIITGWLRKKGEAVRKGDILFSYETDKAAFDMESPADGILLDILFDDGTEVPVLTNVAVIGAEGENIASFYTDLSLPSENDEAVRKIDSGQTSGQSVKEPPADSNLMHAKARISPRARKLAGEKGLNYINITGSGPHGRIIYSDIEKALQAQPDKPEPTKHGVDYEDHPLSNVRKLIAASMHSSLQNSAQLTHHMSADARNILEARRRIKEGVASGTGDQDITLNDIVCWCTVRALKKFPEANSHFLGDRIRIYSSVNLAVAVDTPRGLMVPVVKNADDMDLEKLSMQLKSAADACRKGNIDPELIKSTSASFTVSNLGSYGVEIFTPVINLPQAAILGVCTIINRPADLGNNTFGFVPYIGLSLTYDHRAIDGGPATLFLRGIKEEIEKFRY